MVRPVVPLAALLVSACLVSRHANDDVPSPTNADIILFMGADLPDAGTVIGAHFLGTSHDVRQSTYQLTEAVRSRWSRTERERGAAIMRAIGYRVRAVGLATSDAEQLVGVQYGLAGKVTALAVRSTGSPERLDVDAQADISWELLDLGGGAAVFGHHARGAAQHAATVEEAVGRALDDALERLIGEDAFLRALHAPRADPDAGRSAHARPMPAERELIALADSDINASSDTSVVTRISAGIVSLRLEAHSIGTAFLLTRDGLAIAVGRSVRGASRLRARFASGVERPAQVLRSNASLDVALLQVSCPQLCQTVDWAAPEGVDPLTGVAAVGAPEADESEPVAVFGQVGGRWGLARGVTLEGTSKKASAGWPVARTSTGQVFAVVSTQTARVTAILLSEVLAALRVRAPDGRSR